MFVGRYQDMPKVDMSPSGAKGATKQVVIGPEQGWEDHVLRVMTVEPGGNTPDHAHDWPHINYVISGNGTVQIDGDIHPVSAGVCAFVPSNAAHSFVNTGDVPLEFICIVPLRGEK